MVIGTEREFTIYAIPGVPKDLIEETHGNLRVEKTEKEFSILRTEHSDKKILEDELRRLEDKHNVNLWIKPDFINEEPFLFVFDLDSTLIQMETIDLLAELAGVSDQVKLITKKAMEGELDFEQALRTRATLLKGLESEDCWEKIISKIKCMDGALEIASSLNEKGIKFKTAIVSGGFQPVVEHFRKSLRMDYSFANTLEVKEGKFTGNLIGQIITPSEKLKVLQELAKKYNVPACNVIAIGDGANDIPMIGGAGVGVAFKAKAILREHSRYRFDHGQDLTLIMRVLFNHVQV